MAGIIGRTGCVALYAARIRFLCQNALQAQEFGTPPGSDDEPWGEAFQLRAAAIYRSSLPRDYLTRLCSVFIGCSLTMSEEPTPNGLELEWLRVQCYFDASAKAIGDELQLGTITASWEDPTGQEPTTPGVVRFEKLASIASEQGFRELVDAAEQVSRYLLSNGANPPVSEVSDQDKALLRDLHAGQRIVDIANKHGFSERAMYREFAHLWERLGVTNRQQGVALAAENGWLSA